MAPMLRSFLRVLPALTVLAVAAPVWNTPATCVRELSTYSFPQCTQDLDVLIRMARESIRGIEVVGMRLIDVVGPGASVLPDDLPVTHTCYPRKIREQDPGTLSGWQWTDDEFVPFRLNLQCDDQDIITAYSWH